ncbi:hypothetical protein GCM10027059_26330 [Myceligenerans halotolerans]
MNLDEILGIDPDDPMDALAERLVAHDENLLDELIALRKQRGYSRSDMAREIGTTEAVIARMEQGERDPQLSLLRHYALVLQAEIRHQVDLYDHARVQHARRAALGAGPTQRAFATYDTAVRSVAARGKWMIRR